MYCFINYDYSASWIYHSKWSQVCLWVTGAMLIFPCCAGWVPRSLHTQIFSGPSSDMGAKNGTLDIKILNTVKCFTIFNLETYHNWYWSLFNEKNHIWKVFRWLWPYLLNYFFNFTYNFFTYLFHASCMLTRVDLHQCRYKKRWFDSISTIPYPLEYSIYAENMPYWAESMGNGRQR